MNNMSSRNNVSQNKRVLILIKTYYQLIVAIQLKFTCFSECDVTLVLSDNSQGMEKVSAELKKIGIFENVNYSPSKDIFLHRNVNGKIRDFIDLSFHSNNRFEYYLNGIDDWAFDEIIAYNSDLDICGIFSTIYERNNKVIFSRFEEGILSYSSIPRNNAGRRFIRFLRHMLQKKDLTDVVKFFYCFYPFLYKGELLPIKVPLIKDSASFKDIIYSVFEIKDYKLNYPQKYIYFTSVCDFEGGKPIGEYENVCRVAELVGKDNLLIKQHPRDTRTIYTDEGFYVDINSDVPWEVIQLSMDFSDKVFMTATSGSVLAGSLMSENPVKTYYMYKTCDLSGNPAAQRSEMYIQELLDNDDMKKVLNNVSIVENIEDVLIE